MEEFRIRISALAIVVWLLLASFSVMMVSTRATASTGIKIGDYWTYETGMDMEGLSLSMTVTQKVSDTQGSGSSEVYLIKMKGSGDFSGTVEGSAVDGSATISGTMKRLVSNFSLVSQSIDLSMKMSMMGETATMTMGTDAAYSPAFDDYIGDNHLGHGGTLVSSSTVVITLSTDIEVMGQHIPSSQTLTEHADVTMVVGATNKTVTVAAGTFDCYSVSYSATVGNDTSTLTYYYSDKAGNYVKVDGVPETMADMFTTGELKSYSYGGNKGGASALFSA